MTFVCRRLQRNCAKRQAGRGGHPSCPVTVAVALIALSLVACKPRTSATDAKASKGGARAVMVSVAQAHRAAVPVEIRTFGTAETKRTVSVRAQVSDVLTRVCVQKGDAVAEGQELFHIEPAVFRLSVRQAEASRARNMVLLDNAKKDLVRETRLADKGSSSPEALDKATAAMEALAATTRADQATIDNAQLQLDRCVIRAPVAGRIGDILVHTGNLVRANDQVLAVINQIQPIEVRFAVPQQDLPRVRAEMGRGELAVSAIIPDDPGSPERGLLRFLDNQVDKATGTIQLAGDFVNTSQRLWPGLLVHVVLTLAEESGALVVPSEAVQTGRNPVDGSATKYVFVVAAGHTAHRRLVTVDRNWVNPKTGRAWTVLSAGVTDGETVVTQGQFQLTDGSAVRMGPTSQPASRPERGQGGGE